jgi:Fe-S oxidoreductase
VPALAPRPFRDLSPADAAPLPGALGRTLEGVTIAYFVQCLTDQLYPEMGRAIVETLQCLGARVVFPRDQHCCGLPAADSGDPDGARQMAKHTIRSLQRCQADYIVSGATSCVVAALNDYPHLFAQEPEWRMAGRALAEKFFDFTSFLDTVARLPAGSLVAGLQPRITYHYFCQSHNVLGIGEEPLRLLHEVCGLEIVPLPEATVCCGFGGSVSLSRPEMSERILARKLTNVRSTGVSILVTDNPGCIMHLRGGLAAARDEIRVRHTAEVVADQIRALRAG